MKQVLHSQRGGTISVQDVPIPALSDAFVLVRNHASVISAGTEKTKIDTGKMSLLEKARARPDLVKQVLEKVRREGFRSTYRTVQTRLDTETALGYSSAGEVVAVGVEVRGIQPGDRVACAGADYANHAEFAVVPQNLVARIPDGVNFEEAAFTTVASIALQGVRLADPKIGEVVLVIGLGLLGQMTVQLLRANGCTVIATDLDPALVERATQYGAIGVPPGTDVAAACRHLTAGHGADAAVVCAGTSSNSVIELCGAALRNKGRVVVVGAVRMDIPREPFFKKEISVVISRSYGPGRYDPVYEEAGHDYPYGYVRFTEQRNMATVLELMKARQLNVRDLITHRFPVDDAPKAYQLLEGTKTTPYLGIVLAYPLSSESKVPSSPPRPAPRPAGPKLTVAFLGAGNYATAHLLPGLASMSDVAFGAIATASGRTAASVGKQFGFATTAPDLDGVLASGADAVVIATRHNTHASACAAALEAGCHVFVEKPLAVTLEQLQQVHAAAHANPGVQLMVGFNRRFAPATDKVRHWLEHALGPRVINIRVNGGFIPPTHWIHDAKIGGGRIIGEGCHFVDLAAALAGSTITGVQARGAASDSASAAINDNVAMMLTFQNGSVATITYTSAGSRNLPKERVEVFAGGRCAVIEDFAKVILYADDRATETVAYSPQDKGQRAMLRAWVAGLRTGIPCVSQDTLFNSSLATLLMVDSMAIDMPLPVAPAQLRVSDPVADGP
jgi:polar amino acid transport system substrate-binding protein